MNTLTWVAIFIGAALLWIPRGHRLSLVLLSLGYASAFASGELDLRALIPLGLLLGAGLLLRSAAPPVYRIIAHLLFIGLALALGLHQLPGFHNPLVVGPTRLTPEAVPFTMYLNLDKPLIGFWLLLVWPYRQLQHATSVWLKVGVLGGIASTIVCLLVAIPSGMVEWAPKWPLWGGLWAINNLWLVSLAEEAFFRGYLQEALTRKWVSQRWGAWASLLAASALFGLAHLAGGWQWVMLATLAGVCNGLAYRYGGLQAAMLSHFSLNLVHFSLFTYPMLAR